jgi:transposase
MYIVPSTRKVDGKRYTYYNLVEGVRTAKGPRQRVVLSLGKLDAVPPERIKLLGRLIDQRLRGQIRLLPPESEDPLLQQEAERIARLVVERQAETERAGEPVAVHIDSVTAGEAVALGPIAVGRGMWHRLELDAILAECGFSPRQRNLAMIEVVSRLVNPGSELATGAWVTRTAFADLLGEKLDYVNKDALYRVSDRLWVAREAIESALAAGERELFDLGETMVLYDLSSTYFEGRAEANPKAKRGYSRDHRGDCNQVVVGMVLDEEGFAKASEVWGGNTRDNTTLETMLEGLSARSAGARGATVVMDRGIATAENLALLRERGYHYLVGVASQSRAGWTQTIRDAQFETLDAKHPGIEVLRAERDGEVFLVVRSAERTLKDRAIRERFLPQLEAEVGKLAERYAAGKLSKEKAQTRIGKLRQRYQRASRFVRTEFVTEDGRSSLHVDIDQEKLSEAELLDGVYILKTDRDDLSTEQLWHLYMMLERVERSFRYLKSDLGIRPIYHHLEGRSDAHIFISILAYHLLHAVEQLCRANGDNRSWPTLNGELDTHRALTVEFGDAAGRRHHLRLATKPTEEQKRIYRMLGLSEQPLRTRRYVVEPAGSDENGDAVLST